MSNPTITPTLINPLYQPLNGITKDIPLDGGQQSQTALLFGILSELRVISTILMETSQGHAPSEDLIDLRRDNFTYLDPTFLRQA